MAARTLTYTTNMAASPPALHAGPTTITFNCNSGATKFGTVSDVFLLGKIPAGSVVTEVGLSFGTQGSAASTFSVLLLSDEGSGTFSVLATLSPATSGSITANATTAQKYVLPGAYK